MGEVSKVVLVTGCSSGIGRATAVRLAKSGMEVVATAREVTSLGPCEAAGCAVASLDVDDEGSMVATVERVRERHGPIGVLVNNAGYSQSGAVESLPLEKVRRQFQTNVFGPLRLIQLVAPGMRAQRWGRIVNVGSMGGRFTFPGGGAYHATKHALEALTDALRFEMEGFGIDVVLIQPGLIRSGFADAVGRQLAEVKGEDGPYGAFNVAVEASTSRAYASGPLLRLGGVPDDVAKAIERAITAARPKTRYLVTPSARLVITARSMMSDRAWDRFCASSFPRPR
jgi:NAD(P)-dependent dehydrogenase (short-subunit alcohol dehydrogenase family)